MYMHSFVCDPHNIARIIISCGEPNNILRLKLWQWRRKSTWRPLYEVGKWRQTLTNTFNVARMSRSHRCTNMLKLITPHFVKLKSQLLKKLWVYRNISLWALYAQARTFANLFGHYFQVTNGKFLATIPTKSIVDIDWRASSWLIGFANIKAAPSTAKTSIFLTNLPQAPQRIHR